MESGDRALTRVDEAGLAQCWWLRGVLPALGAEAGTIVVDAAFHRADLAAEQLAVPTVADLNASRRVAARDGYLALPTPDAGAVRALEAAGATHVGSVYDETRLGRTSRRVVISESEPRPADATVRVIRAIAGLPMSTDPAHGEDATGSGGPNRVSRTGA
jgi:hypothetical protein